MFRFVTFWAILGLLERDGGISMFSVEQIKQLNDLEREVYQAILQQKEAVLHKTLK